MKRCETILGRLGMVAVLLLALVCAGCAIFGAVANAVPKYVDARYKGLQNQKVAVMVWADRGVRTDFASIQVDTAASIQKKLKDRMADKAEELKGTNFPWEARSVYRFQVDHPDMEASPLVETAPRISGITRLIYIEIQNFSTQSEEALQLSRGQITATIRVLEIADGKAKIVYEESGVGAVFPPKSPPEGLPNGDPYRFYLGTIDQFSTEVMHRFVTYEVEQ